MELDSFRGLHTGRGLHSLFSTSYSFSHSLQKYLDAPFIISVSEDICYWAQFEIALTCSQLVKLEVFIVSAASTQTKVPLARLLPSHT